MDRAVKSGTDACDVTNCLLFFQGLRKKERKRKKERRKKNKKTEKRKQRNEKKEKNRKKDIEKQIEKQKERQTGRKTERKKQERRQGKAIQRTKGPKYIHFHSIFEKSRVRAGFFKNSI